MIGFATEKNREGIIRLWQEAFGDDEKFISEFMEKMNFSENMLVFSENNQVMAMATILPVFCKNLKGRYVYAVATAKSYRGKGLCKAIMNFVDEYMESVDEDFAILVPASGSLFEFYRKLGYCQTVYKPSFPQNGEGVSGCTVSEYQRIRGKLFKDYDLIGWSERNLEYILSFGKTTKLYDGAAYSEDGVVKEYLSPVIFEKEWTESFALVKYFRGNPEFDKPYFGLCIN